jgi:hypothetical protein
MNIQRPSAATRRKSIHWHRRNHGAVLERHRKARLQLEERAMLDGVVDLMWTDQAALKDEAATLAGRLNIDVRQFKRVLSQLVEKRELTRRDGLILDEQTERDIAQLHDSYPVAKKDLSEKCNGNSKNGSTDLESRLRTSSLVPPESDAAAAAFERFWTIWPESQFKRWKSECRGLYTAALGATTPAELEAAARAHATKHPGQFAGAPKKWLTTAGWQDYAIGPHVDRDAPGASNLPLWDDAEKLRARDLRGHFPVSDWVLTLALKGGGWHAELGPSLTSGERTVLHDYIAGKPELIDRLERECGTEIPGWMRDAADVIAAGNIVPFAQRAAVDVRALA